MTSGTKCSKCGSTDGIGFMGDVPMCMDCYGVPQVDPPPLQPGDAVWVRAVVHDTDGTYGEFADGYLNVRIAGVTNTVPLSTIRRIEGEVKP